MITTYVVDLETTAQGGPDGTSPEAHWVVNRVLHCGYFQMNSTKNVQIGDGDLITALQAHLAAGDHVTLVGHNLKFDLKYLMRDHPHVEWHRMDYVCTMHREYRMSGHQDKFLSLEAACEKRGVRFTKGLDLGAILASGIKMQDIPDSDLIPYLKADVAATANLYAVQNSRFTDPRDRILSNHVLPLASMELNGLKLDQALTVSKHRSLQTEEARYYSYLLKLCEERLEWNDGDPIEADEIKVNAPRTISYLLTGEPRHGLVKGTSKRSIRFASGHGPILHGSEVTRLWGTTTPDHLGYPVPVIKLEEIAKMGYKLPHKVLGYRGVIKLMNTYYGPFLDQAQAQGTVHPKLHICSTATGRGSSSAPNGQNLPPTARECFMSTKGLIMEIDFKQLEICALAAITQDPVLIADIQNGADIHFNTGRSVMNWKTPADMTDAERRIVKAVNFGLIYGGGANGLSISTGQPVKLIKDLIKSFFRRYQGVAIWQKAFYTEVTNAMTHDGIKDGEQVYCSDVVLPISKRLFHFRESKSPQWLRHKTGRAYSFKPTETKNYPVQGFAGGDIVMDALVYLYHELADQKDTLMRMTVHDSVVLDTSKSIAAITEIMKRVCDMVVTKYVLPFDLKFDIKSGSHWK